MNNEANTIPALPSSFDSCPCCGRMVMMGEKGICPVACYGYRRAIKAHKPKQTTAEHLDGIVLYF